MMRIERKKKKNDCTDDCFYESFSDTPEDDGFHDAFEFEIDSNTNANNVYIDYSLCEFKVEENLDEEEGDEEAFIFDDTSSGYGYIDNFSERDTITDGGSSIRSFASRSKHAYDLDYDCTTNMQTPIQDAQLQQGYIICSTRTGDASTNIKYSTRGRTHSNSSSLGEHKSSSSLSLLLSLSSSTTKSNHSSSSSSIIGLQHHQQEQSDITLHVDNIEFLHTLSLSRSSSESTSSSLTNADDSTITTGTGSIHNPITDTDTDTDIDTDTNDNNTHHTSESKLQVKLCKRLDETKSEVAKYLKQLKEYESVIGNLEREKLSLAKKLERYESNVVNNSGSIAAPAAATTTTCTINTKNMIT
jgi:hypothetical protein